MTSESILTIMTWISGVYLLLSAASIILAAKTIYDLKQQIRRLGRPAVPRDSNGRPLKERL